MYSSSGCSSGWSYNLKPFLQTRGRRKQWFTDRMRILQGDSTKISNWNMYTAINWQPIQYTVLFSQHWNEHTYLFFILSPHRTIKCREYLNRLKRETYCTTEQNVFQWLKWPFLVWPHDKKKHNHLETSHVLNKAQYKISKKLTQQIQNTVTIKGLKYIKWKRRSH